jgi:pimeloyl-ACP methyl ester carboxylesterase
LYGRTVLVNEARPKGCAGEKRAAGRDRNRRGGVLSGWLYHNAEDGAPLVLYFGGNGENAATRVRTLIDNDQLSYFEGYNIAVFDYPGYGKSSGTPSEQTLKDAGLTAYDAVIQRSDVDKNRIVVFGYSIGTGVADYVASEWNVAGLMLMAPYADGYDLYNGMVNIFHGPLHLLDAFKMESVKFAGDVVVKPLVLASESDEMVGYASSVRLSKAFPAGCTFQTIPNVGHNDFWGFAYRFAGYRRIFEEGLCLMNREAWEKALRPALWIALTGALISLLFRMMIYGGNWVERLIPLELAMVFGGAGFALARVPVFRRRTELLFPAGAVAIAAAVALLKMFG